MSDEEEGNSMDSAFAGVGDALEQKEKTKQEDTQESEPQLQGDINKAVETTHSDSQKSSSNAEITQQSPQTKRQQVDQSDTPNKGNIPHRIKYDSPTEGRQSLNIYVTTEDKQRLNDLKNLAEQEFNRSIKVIDVYLASLRSDFYDNESFLTEMRRIGYGYFDD